MRTGAVAKKEYVCVCTRVCNIVHPPCGLTNWHTEKLFTRHESLYDISYTQRKKA